MHGEIGIDIESPVQQRSKFIVQCQPLPIGMDRISIRYVCACVCVCRSLGQQQKSDYGTCPNISYLFTVQATQEEKTVSGETLRGSLYGFYQTITSLINVLEEIALLVGAYYLHLPTSRTPSLSRQSLSMAWHNLNRMLSHRFPNATRSCHK